MAYEPEIRISDDDRNQVIDRLQQATSEGRITMEEFQVRTKDAYAARFPADLEPLIADLPESGSALAKPATPPSTKPGRRWHISIMGGNERKGNWDPGEHSVAITIMGGQDLDLTEVEADVVNLTVFTLMGGTDVIVPRGTTVDLGGFMLFGGLGNDSDPNGDSNMRVNIRAFGGMGACDVRNLTEKQIAKRAKRRAR